MIKLFLVIIFWVFIAIVSFQNPANGDLILAHWIGRVFSAMSLFGGVIMVIFILQGRLRDRKRGQNPEI